MANKEGKFSSEMYSAIEALVQKRESWQKDVYERSNLGLYDIIGDCLKLYRSMTQGEGVKARKEALEAFIKAQGYRFRDSTGLEAKVIRCVFGDKDRRRLQTYTAVLRGRRQLSWPVGVNYRGRWMRESSCVAHFAFRPGGACPAWAARRR